MSSLPGSAHSILAVCPRHIGDVLFAAPIVRSLKRAYPGAAIGMRVFEGTEGVLSSNPDLRRAMTIPSRIGLRE